MDIDILNLVNYSASPQTIAFIVALTMGLGTAINKATSFNVKFIPLINITVGIGLAMLVLQSTSPQTIIDGLVAGLTASGLYSTTKNVKEGLNGNL